MRPIKRYLVIYSKPGILEDYERYYLFNNARGFAESMYRQGFSITITDIITHKTLKEYKP